MRLFDSIRCMMLCGLCLTSGCARLQNLIHPAPAKSGAQAFPEASNDEEAGAKDLRNRLRRFRAALSDKHFAEADNELKGAEEGIRVASEITRAHPDYEELADAVRAGRPRLETAIEDDRVAKRNAAIDDLIHRGQTAIGRADVIFEELGSRTPEAEDLQNINDLVKTISDLQREGEPYTQEKRYQVHAQKRDDRAARLAVIRVRVARQIQTQQAVIPAITAGIVAANDAKAATNDDTRINLYNEVVKNFSLCAGALDTMTTQAGYDPSLVIETKLGKLTAQQTRASCSDTSRQATARVAGLMWQKRVQNLVTDLDAALHAVDPGTEPETREAAHHKVVTVLRACQEDPNIDATAPGFDNKAHFDTPFGRLAVPQLIARCSHEIGVHNALTLQVHWQAQAVSITKRLDAIETRMAQAGHAESPARQSAEWSAVVGGLRECAEQCQSLMQLPGADAKQNFTTPWGSMTMPQIGYHCAKEQEKAAGSLARTLKHVEAQAFLAECHNDEVAVVQREGIPGRIDAMGNGRVFVYIPQDGHGNTTRYAFDAEGHRLDLTVRYKAQVDELLNRMATLLPQARAGGRDGAQATETLLPLLEKCQGGSLTEHGAEFDGSVNFDTPFGRLDGPALSRACGTELTRERKQSSRLAWQVRMQALADRATAAAQELQDAPQAANAAEQLSRAAAAKEGIVECRERARALVQAEGADRSFKTASPWGRQSIDELARSCAHALPEAERVLARAEIRQKLATFISTCQADEREVGERNGLPTRIEPKGTGRVFVYGKKRIAFDAAGHRTDEKLLQDK